MQPHIYGPIDIMYQDNQLTVREVFRANLTQIGIGVDGSWYYTNWRDESGKKSSPDDTRRVRRWKKSNELYTLKRMIIRALNAEFPNSVEWMPRYRHMLDTLNDWSGYAWDSLDYLEMTFSQALEHDFMQNKWCLNRDLIEKLQEAQKVLFFWQGVQPFVNFSNRCLERLDLAIKCIRLNRRLEAKADLVLLLGYLDQKSTYVLIAQLMEDALEQGIEPAPDVRKMLKNEIVA